MLELFNQKRFETELKTVYGSDLELRTAKDGAVEYLWNGVVVGVWHKRLNLIICANELDIPEASDLVA